MSKITRATFKKFVRENAGNLFILKKSSFDGMTDCVEETGQTQFSRTIPIEYSDHTLGIAFVRLVGQGRDYYKHYEDEYYEGIDVYNSCGHFILAKMKEDKKQIIGELVDSMSVEQQYLDHFYSDVEG